MLAHLLLGVSSVFLKQGSLVLNMEGNLVTEIVSGGVLGIPALLPWADFVLSGVLILSIMWTCETDSVRSSHQSWFLERRHHHPLLASEGHERRLTASRGRCGAAHLGASCAQPQEAFGRARQSIPTFSKIITIPFRSIFCLYSFGRYEIEMQRTRTC